MKTGQYNFDFNALIAAIQQVHNQLTEQAGRAINISLTLRNWLIGYLIAEYEQHERDRAIYGQALLSNLAIELSSLKFPRTDERELRRYRLFYKTYPQIQESLAPELSEQLFLSLDSGDAISQIQESTKFDSKTTGSLLVSHLSFSHFVELIAVLDEWKRIFYEVECIKGN